jgi:hypothetical protein
MSCYKKARMFPALSDFLSHAAMLPSVMILLLEAKWMGILELQHSNFELNKPLVFTKHPILGILL